MTFQSDSLKTVHLVPLTAFTESGQFNAAAQAQLSSDLYAAGIRSFLPAAGTSEFHSLSTQEVISVVRTTVAAVGPDANVFAPVGLQLSHAQKIADECMTAGATGIMFMPFSHPYLSDSGARDYFHSVMDSTPCPTLIYKKSPLPSNELLLEMAAHDNVVGVKYAWNQMHEFRTTVIANQASQSKNIEWICGSAERFAPYYFLAGSNGYTTGAGNICPRLTLAMHAAFTRGDFETGMQLQQQILPIENFRARNGDSFNISMLKYALSLTGRDFGSARPPQRQLNKAEQQEVAEIVADAVAAEAGIATQTADSDLE